MATRQATSPADGSRVRVRRRSAKSAQSQAMEILGLGDAQLDFAIGEPATSIEGVIENERVRLGCAHSILKCLQTALVHSAEHSKTESSHAEVADVAISLIRESVHRLDSLYIRPLLSPPPKASRKPARQAASARK